jgi:hypothetical protein
VGGESFILTIAELKTLLEIQRNMEDQQICLTTAPEISAFIERLHNEITSQNLPPSPLELKMLKLEREWGTGDMGTNQDTEDQDAGIQEVPLASIEPIREKLAMKIFDEYANIQKGMYSIRCNGKFDHGSTPARPVHGRSDHEDTPACPTWGSTSPLINSLTDRQPNKIRKHKERDKRGEE